MVVNLSTEEIFGPDEDVFEEAGLGGREISEPATHLERVRGACEGGSKSTRRTSRAGILRRSSF